MSVPVALRRIPLRARGVFTIAYLAVLLASGPVPCRSAAGPPLIPDHVWDSDAYWSTQFAAPDPDGDVMAFDTYRGDPVIGGRFLQIGLTDCGSLARWDGREWRSFRSGPRDPVTAILAEGDQLTVATEGARTTIRQWNKHAWTELDNSEFTGRVVRLLRWKGDLIAAGAFRSIEDPEAQFELARWEPGRWRRLGPVVRHQGASVSDAAVYQERIHLAGNFAHPGTFGIGLLRLTDDARAYDTLAADASLKVQWARALAVWNGELVVGATFFVPGSPATGLEGLLAWNGSTWRRVDSVPEFPVTTLHATSLGLVAAGASNKDREGQLAGPTVIGRLGSGGWALEPQLDLRPLAVGEWSGRVVAVGSDALELQLAEPPSPPIARHVAVSDGSSWHGLVPMRSNATGLDGAVFAMIVQDGQPIVVGSALRYWTGDGWQPSSAVARMIDGRFQPVGDLRVSTGYSLAWFQDAPYVGVTGDALNTLMRFDGSRWTAVAGIRGDIHALTVHEGCLIAGGSFYLADDPRGAAVAAYDGERWSRIGADTGVPDSVAGVVYALCSHEGSLYVGGELSNFRGVESFGIARWDGGRWNALAGGVPGSVRAIAPYRDEIAAGGTFGASLWDGARWSSIPEVNLDVEALASDGSALFVGGVPIPKGDSAIAASGPKSQPLLAWDGRQLHPLGSDVQTPSSPTDLYAPYVLSLVVDDQGLWVAGSFTRAGHVASWNVARWQPPGRVLSSHEGSGRSLRTTPSPSRRAQPVELAFARAAAVAELRIVDVAGRVVRVLPLAAGAGRAVWDGRDASGSEAPAGIYFARLSVAGRSVASARIARLP